ncbi:MAG TPA: hypothetical protein VMU84_08360, partial [Thermoanaerobaculia bacterium]|nr:hypothetical protein [Thermoanaerobaculia bacterium]
PIVLVLYGAALVTYLFSYIAPSRVVAHPQTRFIMRLALTEAVAIYGLIAALIAHDWRIYIGPWIVAIVGFMQAMPSEQDER